MATLETKRVMIGGRKRVMIGESLLPALLFTNLTKEEAVVALRQIQAAIDTEYYLEGDGDSFVAWCKLKAITWILERLSVKYYYPRARRSSVTSTAARKERQ